MVTTKTCVLGWCALQVSANGSNPFFSLLRIRWNSIKLLCVSVGAVTTANCTASVWHLYTKCLASLYQGLGCGASVKADYDLQIACE